MKSICNKCKHLWSEEGKYYCNRPSYLYRGDTCKYSKNKKSCPCYEEGENVKKYIKKGWWRKK